MALLLELGRLHRLHGQRQQMERRLFRDRSNPLDFLSDEQVIKRYRLDRDSIFDLCDDFKNQLERPTNRSSSLPVSLQIMITLRYYASGSYLNVIGDAHGVSKMAVSRSITDVTRFIVRDITKYIKFPMTNEEQMSVKYAFFDIKEFPLVLGAIDGTLIPIKVPSVDEPLYVCRKGYHALNIQCVCDANYLFLDVVAKWPGSAYDSHIWNNCKLSEAFESGIIKDGWLLGDSGYGLRPWLLTPVLNPTTPKEKKYNRAHKSTRCVIERTYGIWKMRFRCLYKGLTFIPNKNIDVILATAALHNICMKKRLPLDGEVPIEQDGDQPEVNIVDSDDGRRLRAQIIENIFA